MAGKPPAKAVAIRAEVVVEAGDWPSAARLRRLTEKALVAAAGRSKATLAAGSEVAVIFTDDAHIRLLNRRFRHKNKPTNVLSFPAAPPAGGVFGPLLGDIVLAFETVVGEAEAAGLALADHLTHLIVHGFLHLIGYDHEEDEQAAAMEGLETAILATLAIADPYGGHRG